MSFVERLISLKFTLATGTFAGGLNQLTVGPANLRVKTKIIKAGGASMGMLQAVVYGLKRSQMNTLSTLGMKINVIPKNVVSVMAGDARNGMSLVFEGGITQAFADLNSSPNVGFIITAMAGIVEAVDSIVPTSYKGGVDVVTVMATLAKQANPPLAFENNGVSVQLSNPYWPGSVRSQIQAAAEAANIGWAIDNGTLTIWPKNSVRNTSVVDISPTTGMIGYPSFTAQGIQVRTIFNPAIKFMGKVQVTSDFVPTSLWAVYTLEHDLDAHEPHGNWQSTLGCYNPNFPQPVTK